jgi:hypothetical protein
MAETWTLARIDQMIADGIEEGRTIEYKAADALQKTDGKKNEISKDVSAFANAGGGTIIYGVKEFDAPNKRHLPERIDPINRGDISKEWLEQIINTKIQPRLQGVEIYPVEISKTDNTVIYVIEIPQSTTAHQAAGHKYYKRYNFESVPMEDYEIRDIMNRRIHPELVLKFKVEIRNVGSAISYNAANLEARPSIPQAVLMIQIHNKGSVYANYVNYYVTLNRYLVHDSLHENLMKLKNISRNIDLIQYYGENTLRDVIDYTLDGYPMYGPSRYDPILPGTHSRSEEVQLTDGDLRSFNEDIISWVIHADNSPPRRGQVKFGDIKIVETYKR